MAEILTKTIIRSPVVRWILQVRIRERHFNDVVFVGEDFIHVKQVKEHGHLHHIATKADFSCRIRAAKALTIESTDEDRDALMTNVNGLNIEDEQATPRQCLVLTTDANELLFIRLVEQDAAGYRFIHQSCALPVFDRLVFQPGEHLAVDHASRALAVAANERELLIYSTKTITRNSDDWCAVAAQRALQVEGVVQLMDFLVPSPDDENHVILLLIVINERRTKAIWIDWYLDSNLHQAQVHPAQTLRTVSSSPGLLIPLRNTSFFLISGSEVQQWEDIHCGSATGSDKPLIEIKSRISGESSRKAAWVNWCRPKRVATATDDADHLYLVREDGVVCLIDAEDDVHSSYAGDFECHVGTSFASIGDYLEDPDILIAGGDMSNGGVYFIGHWSTPIRVADLDRSDTMRMKLVEPVSNWASTTDMVTSTLPGKTQRLRDGIFVTSGRQPYGAITELRKGVESRLLFYFEIDELRTVTDVWALPLAALGHVLIILSSPTGTKFLQLSPDVDTQAIEGIDDASLALTSADPTLAAAFTNDGKIIQITRSTIRISPGTAANFEDTATFECGPDSAITAAAVDARKFLIVTTERTKASSAHYVLVVRSIISEDIDAMDGASTQLRTQHNLPDEPLCVGLVCQDDIFTTFVVTSKGELLAYTMDYQGSHRCTDQRKILLQSSEDSNLCDNLVVIHDENGRSKLSTHWLVICGLRDGTLWNVVFHAESSYTFGESGMVKFSSSAVKLAQHPNSRYFAYAMNGLDTCILSWDGRTASSLNIRNVWVSDKLRPELSQGAVMACTHMPHADELSAAELADAFVMISGAEFMVTSSDRTPTVVPRRILLSGTPNRLIYAEQQRCLVCASLCYDARYFPSSLPQSKPEERRQIWPVIDFIPSWSSEISCTYEMQPGERVYSLLEWSVTLKDEKTYSFILVGGSYISKSKGRTKGRIRFLQPVNRNWTITDVTESRMITFENSVYALALVDELTYVACVGKRVIVHRFSVDETKWEQICSPFELSSPGIYITFEQGLIHVSTSEDSYVALKLHESGEAANATSTFSAFLEAVQHAPQADALLCHTTSNMDSSVLIASKFGKVLRLSSSDAHLENAWATKDNYNITTQVYLPRSLTRIRHDHTSPLWTSLSGTNNEPFIACATDGSILSLRSIDLTSHGLCLSWLQRLCEWSAITSPHSYKAPPYTASERSAARYERIIPAGLASARASKDNRISVKTNRDPSQDNHLDGDILVRLIEKGGSSTLRKVLQEASAREDRIGEWMRQHLEEELAVVDEVMQLLEELLNAGL